MEFAGNHQGVIVEFTHPGSSITTLSRIYKRKYLVRVLLLRDLSSFDIHYSCLVSASEIRCHYRTSWSPTSATYFPSWLTESDRTRAPPPTQIFYEISALLNGLREQLFSRFEHQQSSRHFATDPTQTASCPTMQRDWSLCCLWAHAAAWGRRETAAWSWWVSERVVERAAPACAVVHQTFKAPKTKSLKSKRPSHTSTLASKWASQKTACSPSSCWSLWCLVSATISASSTR